jgi:hypothetical protein
MNGHVIISPAYGRDYKTAEAAIKDFEDGKDFILHDMFTRGKYCSIRDFPGKLVEIRYNRFQDLIMKEVPCK